MDRGLPAVLRQRDRWVSPATEKKFEEAWGPRGSPHICQVKCFSHRALRLHVDTHFLLFFCSCGFHDVFPYPVTLHKMDCFAGENHVVDEDCFPEFVDTIRPVIKKAITLAALDVGFQQLLFTARQQSPLIRSHQLRPPSPQMTNQMARHLLKQRRRNLHPAWTQPAGNSRRTAATTPGGFYSVGPRSVEYHNGTIPVEGLRGAPEEETAWTSGTTQVPIATTVRTGLRISVYPPSTGYHVAIM